MSVRLEISDTGPGMTEQEKHRIFDPFFTTKFAGRGLGLSVVQGVVRAHKGEIDLTSAPGQGTTFQILLPSAIEAPETGASLPTVAASTRSQVGPRTVLLVEDEEMLPLGRKDAPQQGLLVIQARTVPRARSDS